MAYLDRAMSTAAAIGLIAGVGLTACVAATVAPDHLPTETVVAETAGDEPVTSVGTGPTCYEDEFTFLGHDGEPWCVAIDLVVLPDQPYADEWAQLARPADRE